MNAEVNRAEQLWYNWEERQRQLQGIPGLAGEGAMAIKWQQYDFLRQGLYRIGADPTEKEVLFMKVIGAFTEKLQRQLYPNPLARLLHRLKAIVYDRPMHLRKFSAQREANLTMLKGQLKALGFLAINGRLENYLDYETSRVGIPLTQQLNGETRLDILLKLESDGLGAYRFTQYEATLLRHGEHGRSWQFDAKDGMTVLEAANLLDGRPVRKGVEIADGRSQAKWLQLDFAGKDERPVLQEFHPGYAYELKDELLKLGMQTAIAGLSKSDTVRSLEAGNVAMIRFGDKGTFYLHANPAGQGLSLFDRDKKPLELAQLLKAARQYNFSQPQIMQVVKMHDRGKVADQSQGIGR